MKASFLKKIWINERDGAITISIRQNSRVNFNLVMNTTLMPPSEKINGKKLNIHEAIEKNLVEQHHVLGCFRREDLFDLRNKIDQFLKGE